ncbi:MAG: hypothetical protein JXX14_06310 [Deltaproteobacteria bacterium]|nr:hypothetical protein [Deltaproteobacteria bacterium]
MNKPKIFHMVVIFPVCLVATFSAVQTGCDSDASTQSNGITIPDVPTAGVTDGCGSVRMTQYTSSDSRWCGFDRTSAILPSFVREGMTVAIAEPWNGGSYEGEPGEACGECWELSTSFATQIVMVHDLCPIEGNPVCAGGHFHFDVSNEVANRIDGGGWLGEGAVRRVPCPVEGNIYAYMTARNEWGYLQIAFFNHRFPMRTVAYRAVDSTQWRPMTRCLARWCLDDDTHTFAAGGPGGIFQFTSATGEQVEATETLTYDVAERTDFNTGVQFAPVSPPEFQEEGVCRFVPPSAIYTDEWGGIDGVRWDCNGWGDLDLVELTEGCADDSKSCIRLSKPDSGGVHITYRHLFPAETFGSLSLDMKSPGGSGTVEVSPRNADERCSAPPTFTVGEEWQQFTVDIASSCKGEKWIQGFTISRSVGISELLIDNMVLHTNTTQ